MSLTTLLILVLVVFVILLGAGLWIASRVKRDINAQPGAGPAGPVTVEVTRACVAQLWALSREPVLVKRIEGDLKVQVGDKPMINLSSIPDRNVRAALREAAVAVDVQYGHAWTSIVRVSGETKLSVTRIA